MSRYLIVLCALAFASCAGCDGENGKPDGWEFGEETFVEETPNMDPNTPPDRPDPNPDRPPPDPDPTPDPDPDPNPNPDPTTPGDLEPLPQPCTGNNPPPRCNTAPEDVTWASAAVFHRLQVMGTESNPECCFDFTGDGQIDNSWGQNLAGFGFLADTNQAMQAAVERGEPAVVLEFDGLTADRQGPIRLNWWLGGFAADGLDPDGTDVLVDANLIDRGSQPTTTFANARLDGNSLTASDGTLLVPFMLFFASPFTVATTPIRRARLEALVLPGPFPTLSGRLGGVIRVTDVYAVVNSFVDRDCACLGLAEPLLEKQTGMCSDDADVQACEDAGAQVCAEVAGACNLYGAVGLFADHDANGDGLNESVSIGLEFEGWPATIVGTR